MTPWTAWTTWKKTRFPSCHWRGDAEDLCMAKPYVEDGVRRAHVSKPCMMDVSATTMKVTQEWCGFPPNQNSGMLHFSRDINGFYTSPIFRRKLVVWLPCSVFLEMPGSSRWSGRGGWSRRREGMETVLKRDFPPVPMLVTPKIYISKKSLIKMHVVKKNIISKIHLFHVFQLFLAPKNVFLKNICPSSRTKRCFIVSKASNALPSWWVGSNHFVDSASAWMLGGGSMAGAL